ncbi:MAG: hypothetical protein N3D77_08355 [Geminicoccaceae bacterium]|nr:hypothetical protein [Geminicoccaceae bacterium]
MRYESLRNGEGRFGWGHVETADMRQLKEKVDAGLRRALTDKEEEC